MVWAIIFILHIFYSSVYSKKTKGTISILTSKNLQTHKNIKKCARFYYRAHFLEGVNTLDATSSASTLPEQKEKSLVGEGGFGPPKSVTTDLQSAPFGRSGTRPYMELVIGVEPTTC